MKPDHSEKSKVALIPCPNYDEPAVYEAVKTGAGLIGGIDGLFKGDDKILLKPNLLKKATPEQAVTTHPAVFAAAAKLLRENGFDNLFYGDSPGPTAISPLKVAEAAGIKQKAEALGVKPADFGTGVRKDFPAGKAANGFFLCRGAVESDAIVNLCKMKTHALERITGAVKNTYGCVWGFNKGAGHALHSDPDSFARMLADLNLLLKPRLHIMDAVTAMEGNGPGSGDPVDMGLILVSADPVAMDSVFCALVGLNPSLVPTNVYGEIYGVGKWRPEDIDIVTTGGVISAEQAFEQYGNPKFHVNRAPVLQKQLSFFSRFTDKCPVINRKNCIKCGICVESCPLEKKAIAMDKQNNSVPVYDYSKCIRCYCCQEMCPQKAIAVKVPLRAVLRGVKNKKK